MSHHDHKIDAADTHRKRRRRLLATLGLGLAGTYIAPTLFSVGQAQAWDGQRRSRPSRSRPSWSRPSRSRPSWSRPSRYDGAYRRHKRARHEHYLRHDDRYRSYREYEQDRRRLRDYRENPQTIIEDIVFGRPDRRW